MTHTNPSAPDPEDPKQNAGNPTAKPVPKPRRRRRWVWVLAVVVVGLFLIVLLLPTVLSTAIGRSIVVSQVNKRINGQLQIDRWSLGWFSSIGVQGVSIKDETGRQILQLPELQTQLSLLDIIRGKYALGEIKIENLDALVIRNPDGTINWAKLAKPTTSQPAAPQPAAPAASEPTKLPNISGHVIVANGHVSFEDQTPGGKPVEIRQIQSDINIPDINQPIANSLSAQVQIGGAAPGTISATGSIGAVTNNVLTVSSANVDETVKLSKIDLAVASAFVGKPEMQLAGRGETTAVVKLTNGSAGTASLRTDLSGVTIAQGPPASARQVLAPDDFKVVLDASFTHAASGASVQIPQLEISDAQKIFSITKSADKALAVNLPQTGSPTGSGSVDLAADLKRLNDILQAMSAPQVQVKTADATQLTGGKLAGRLTLGQTDADHVSLAGDLAVTELSVASGGQSPISNETLKLALSASSNHDGSDIELASLGITGSLLTLDVQNGKLSLPKKDAPAGPPWQMLKQALVKLTVPSLPKLQKLAESFSAPKAAPQRGAPIAAASPKVPAGSIPPTTQPTELTSGSLAATIQVTTEGSALHALPQVTISNFAAKQGEKQYAASSITLDSDLTATAAAAGAASPVQEVRISKNNVDVNGLVLDGKVYGEKQLHVGMQAVLQPAAAILDMQNVTIATVDTKALTVVLKGRVSQLFDHRMIDNTMTADIDYDADQVLKLVKPMLSNDLQQRLQDATAAGKYHKQLVVRGSYPANQPFNVAVQNLAASIDIQLDKFDGAGVSLQNMTLPVTLVLGYARLIYADKPTGQNMAPPAAFNGGQLFLGGTQVDLRTSPPTLSTLGNVTLIKDAALNPVFASWSLGTFLANPVFVGADKTTGYLTIVIEKCDQLMLGSELTQAKTGSATLAISIRDLTLSNKLLEQVAALSHTDPSNYRGNLKLHEALAGGTVSHDMNIGLGEGTRSILMKGNVSLADRRMNPMTISLPWKLLGLKNAPKELVSAFPDAIDIPMTGTVEKPQLAFDFNKLVQQSALKGLTGQGANKTGSTTQPDEDPLKAIGDLINNATKKKKK